MENIKRGGQRPYYDDSYSDAFPERFAAVSLRQFSAPLALRTSRPSASYRTPTRPYVVQWLQSGGNLDFCLLAVCSCVLTLLCHQAATVLSATTPANQSIVAPSPSASSSADLNFFIKAALFTSFPELEKQSEEIDDRLK